MGYLHIDNLYKQQDILIFKECYAMEKIHGTSSHININKSVSYFSGGSSHEKFVDLFNSEELLQRAEGVICTIYGEAYGGKLQKMSNTYGKEMKFIAFDVKIHTEEMSSWLDVPRACEFCTKLGLDFVDFKKIKTDLDAIDFERDRDSTQAIRNGCGPGHMREGVVLRPLIELRKNNDKRIIVKHRREEFSETKSPRSMDPEKLKVLEDAEKIAEEWVTPNRVEHVLQKINEPCMEKMREIIAAMQEDVKREGEGEIVWSDTVAKSVGKMTAIGVKDYFKKKLRECE